MALAQIKGAEIGAAVHQDQARNIDATIDDPAIPTPNWGGGSYRKLYN